MSVLVNADAEFGVCELINAVYGTGFRAVQFSVECLIRLEVCSGIFLVPFLNLLLVHLHAQVTLGT